MNPPIAATHSELTSIENIFNKLPPEVKKWAESLPWNQRRYVLSLCHLLCAASPEVQAEFLDEYTADGIIAKLIEDRDIHQKVKHYLKAFRRPTDLTEELVRRYIRQFYMHSAQDVRRQPDLFLESALRLVANAEEKNNIFNYILGFEIIKMMFKMSWYQHEKLYRIQRNQEDFINTYVKPIRHAHRVNQIIVPRDEQRFFARRNYFIQVPEIPDPKLVVLATATFTTDTTTHFGFSIIRHPQALVFDYDYIFTTEPEVLDSPFD
jgi:hypothetical protein